MGNGANWSINWQTALEKIQEHNLSAALEIILETVGYEPENMALINLLADCYYYLGEFDRAKACWEEVLRLNPANQEAKNKIGRYKTPSFQSWLKRYKHALYNIEQKNYEAALGSLRELLGENDGFVSVYQFLGLCYMACAEYDQARIVWQKGLERDIGNETLSDYLNMISDKNEKTLDATVEEKQVSKRKVGTNLPIQKAALALTAAACLLLLFKTGVTPDQGKAFQNQDATLSGQVAAHEAIDEKAAEDSPVSSNNLLIEEERSRGGSDYDLEKEKVYYREGYNAYQEGNLKKATSNLGVVVSMNTGNYLNREALYYLARSCYLQKNYEEAEAYYLQYLEQFPGTNYYDDSLFYLGVVYDATGQEEKAVEALTEMQRISPNCGYESSDFFKSVMKDK
ncbi:hypothetical protein ASZ90_019700 [hydrocarbon metagenome]|uniref:Tetratricopeptide repeat protein n=1 Tax=hydrocarbon metagenome TaxID=938273 RepID=A0A0W8E2U4_9ZZZZ